MVCRLNETKTFRLNFVQYGSFIVSNGKKWENTGSNLKGGFNAYLNEFLKNYNSTSDKFSAKKSQTGNALRTLDFLGFKVPNPSTKILGNLSRQIFRIKSSGLSIFFFK